MSQHITVVDYNPLWPKKYEEEALLIKDILADNCVAIYHIGSTSVEGLEILWQQYKILKRLTMLQKPFLK